MARNPQRINPLVNSGRTSTIAQRVARHKFVAMARRAGTIEPGPEPEPDAGSSVFVQRGAGPAGT